MKKYIISNLLTLIGLCFFYNSRVFVPLITQNLSIGKFVIEAYSMLGFIIFSSLLVVINFEFIALKAAPALYRKKYIISILFIIIGLLVSVNIDAITPKMAPAKYAKWFNDDMWRGAASMENWSSKEAGEFIEAKCAYDNRAKVVGISSIIIFLTGIMIFVYHITRRVISYYRK